MFIQGKSVLRLTFNPGLALTGFRTTRPRLVRELIITKARIALYEVKLFHCGCKKKGQNNLTNYHPHTEILVTDGLMFL